MEAIWNWGLEIVRATQRIESPFMTAAMRAISFFGAEASFLVLLPFIFWCVDEKRGFRLGVTVILSSYLNLTLKTIIKHPRPYELDAAVGRATENTYGLPSHHAQSSATFCFIIGSWLKRPSAWIVGIVVPLIVGFSRVYLGVHFPTDVFAGWLMAAVVVIAYFVIGERLATLLSGADVRVRILASAAAAFAMNAANPAETGLAGAVFGMGAGYVLMTERWPFAARRAGDGGKPGPLNLAARYGLGAIVAGGLYLGLKLLFPGDDSAWYAFFRFLRYGLLGFWVAAGAPWVFLRLKLAAAR